MNDKNVFATVGLVCCDCAYFSEHVGEDGMGVCLFSRPFINVHCHTESCKNFIQRGCESETEKQAIEALRNQYLEEGIKSWRNPYASN